MATVVGLRRGRGMRCVGLLLTVFGCGGDLSWTYAANGRGPVRGRELGDLEAGDGGPLLLGGRAYQKGLAGSSPSLVRYRLGKRCHELLAEIGIDDATGGAGSVVFQVWADVLRALNETPPPRRHRQDTGLM